MVSNVFLGLGSNKGDKLKFLKEAVNLIHEDNNCNVLKSSSVYETSPFGVIKQDNFYNAVIEIETSFEIKNLFQLLKKFEKQIGRNSEEIKWGPREIDIDILFYNDLIYNTDELIVPHQEILKRDFVLIPLKEIAPDYEHPVVHKKVIDLDTSVIEKHIIRKINSPLKEE